MLATSRSHFLGTNNPVLPRRDTGVPAGKLEGHGLGRGKNPSLFAAPGLSPSPLSLEDLRVTHGLCWGRRLEEEPLQGGVPGGSRVPRDIPHPPEWHPGVPATTSSRPHGAQGSLPAPALAFGDVWGPAPAGRWGGVRRARGEGSFRNCKRWHKLSCLQCERRV